MSAITVVYRNGVLQVSLESMQRDHDEYRGVHSGLNWASGEVGSEEVSLEKSLEQELLWDQVTYSEDVTEETLSSVRQLTQAKLSEFDLKVHCLLRRPARWWCTETYGR